MEGRRTDKGVDTLTQPTREIDLCHLLFTKQTLKYRHLDAAFQTFYSRPAGRKLLAESPAKPRDLSQPRGSQLKWQPCPAIAKDLSPRSYYMRHAHATRSPKLHSASILAEPPSPLFREVEVGSSFRTFGIAVKTNCQK